jgi:micrococcal nuclease
VIKGNINAEGVKIYHVPGGGSYTATVITPANGERWFCTEQEAQANGWRKAQN